MMNGGDDVLARDGDRFHFLGAEEKPDIDEKLLGIRENHGPVDSLPLPPAIGTVIHHRREV